MKKLGIGLSNFGANQPGFLAILNINDYLSKNYHVDIIGFYESLIKYSATPNFACMQAVELWGYDGPVVACTLNMAQDLIKIPTVAAKYFYVYDLEWIHLIDKDYEKIKKIYSSPELTLIARCKDHAEVIQKLWNKEVKYIVEDFDMNKLVEIVWNQR